MNRPFDLAHLEERFWSQVDMHEGWDCWEWLGYRNPRTDYGQFSLNTAERKHFDLPRVVTASVLACTLNLGPAQPGQVVLHSCDWRPCCNYYHLRWGTQATNNREAWDRGRQAKGERHHQSRLNDVAVATVLNRVRSGERVRDVAAEVGVDWSTVYAWLRGEGRCSR